MRARIHILYRHFRLWRRLFTVALIREMQYRAHFLATVGVGLAQLVLALVPILLLYSYTDSIRGWSGAQVVALVGLYQLFTGLLGAFIAPNMAQMTELIRRGELDLLLIRPVSPQFYATVRWMVPAELVTALTGLAVVVAGLSIAGVVPGPVDIVQAVLLIGAGFVLVSCLWSALVYLAFWLGAVSPVMLLVNELNRGGQYPIAFFPSAVRAFFTFAFPVAFATSFPAQALGGDGSWATVGLGAGMAVVAMVLVRVYWRRAIQNYASASS